MIQKKGEAAEESVRNHFISQGFFSIRSIPFTFEGDDITDIDVWAYKKSSTNTRERINIDIKNKKSPQAIERIFWAKGVKELLKLDNCAIATTDKRPTVQKFCDIHDVILIDGEQLRVLSENTINTNRLPEERLIELLDTDSQIDESISWNSNYRKSKEALLRDLNFDGSNRILHYLSEALREIESETDHSEASIRRVYLYLSHFCIALDFTTRNLSRQNTLKTREQLTERLRFGSEGRKITEKIFDISGSIISRLSKADNVNPKEIAQSLLEQTFIIKYEILSDHLTKNGILDSLFDDAITAETFAFSLIKPPLIKNAPHRIKAMIGAICDLYNISREQILR